MGIVVLISEKRARRNFFRISRQITGVEI